MNRRGAALLILTLWLTGLALLVQREFFRAPAERLADAALRAAPGATYFAALHDGAHVGYASTVVDTLHDTLRVADQLVADLPMGGRLQRAEARTEVLLSRAMRLRSFTFALDAPSGAIRARGQVDGDSVLTVVVGLAGVRPDTQRHRLTGPVVVSTMAPMVLALLDEPRVGQEHTLPVFDPIALAPRQATLRVEAESLFVIADSAVFDSATARWTGALPDTVRAWRITAPELQLSAWVDAQGRMVHATQLGMVTLARMPHEMAFENWRLDARDGRQKPVTADRDILETTAISANKRVGEGVGRLRVRLHGAELSGFELNGTRQRLAGDTLVITREPPRLLEVTFSQLRRAGEAHRAQLRPGPLVESEHREIRQLANQLLQGSRVDSAGLRVTSPRRVAEAINRWVHDSLRKRISFGIPSALQVLRSRSGDCNEHTQLYVALARAAGLPARVAAGLVYLDGKFYYHAWPEVFLADWVAVDPTLGQFPADAAHLRFVTGGLDRQVELLRLMGTLQIEVLASR